jgi:RNA polymerase sigma-70 factor
MKFATSKRASVPFAGAGEPGAGFQGIDNPQRRAELDLCRACEAGDADALERFDRELIHPLDFGSEVKQLTREKLFVTNRLREFTGKGSLARWVKSVALRLSLDVSRARREDAVGDGMLEAVLPPVSSPEPAVLQHESREALRSAVQKALESLESRDGLFLRQYYLDGLTLTAIGKLHGLVPSTVMRALNRSTDELRREVRKLLARDHHLGEASIDSLVREAGGLLES